MLDDSAPQGSVGGVFTLLPPNSYNERVGGRFGFHFKANRLVVSGLLLKMFLGVTYTLLKKNAVIVSDNSILPADCHGMVTPASQHYHKYDRTYLLLLNFLVLYRESYI
jgi:hypothetical protein